VRWCLHAILLVGFRPPDEKCEFHTLVYHDSLQGPYLTVTADKLAQAAGDVVQRNQPPLAFDFLVLVPRGIDTALGYEISRRPTASRGVFLSSMMWRNQVVQYERCLDRGWWRKALAARPMSQRSHFPLRCPSEVNRFRLVPRADFFNRYVDLNVGGSEQRRRALERWNDVKTRLPSAFWIEEFLPKSQGTEAGQSHPCDDSVKKLCDHTVSGFWGWPATSPSETDASGFMIPCLQCAQGVLSVDFRDTQEDIVLSPEAYPPRVKKPQLLEAGAITSFSVGPLPEALRCLAIHRIRNVDLFILQSADVERYFERPRRRSALQILASRQKPERIPKAAEAIARDIRAVERESGHRFNVRGFATYIPEISSLEQRKRAKAVKALSNIIRIAGILRRDYGIGTRFVEIVAGTSLYGLEPRPPQDPDSQAPEQRNEWFTHRAGRSEKFCALSESLSELSKVAETSDVYLAVEVEPGVLPLVRQLRDIRDLALILANEGWKTGMEDIHRLACPQRVGINLDISHMWLCNVSAEDLADRATRARQGRQRHARARQGEQPDDKIVLTNKEKEEVCNRIAHVHIGDIGPGHMCDLVTRTVSSWERYLPWINLLTGIANRLPRDREKHPDFSCCLSVELEACRSPGMVAAAYHRANFMLREFSLRRPII